MSDKTLNIAVLATIIIAEAAIVLVYRQFCKKTDKELGD